GGQSHKMTVGSEQKAVSSEKTGEKPMTKSILFWLLATVLLTTAPPAQAQQPQKVPRIAYLSVTSPSSISARTEAFRQGLLELGYVERKSIVVEWRYAEGKADHLRELAAEVVRHKADVIVTTGPTTTRAAKEATNVIPIIMAQG